MLATLAVSFALAGSPLQGNAGSALVSKMLQYYSGAKSMTGTITYTATDGAGRVQLLTTLQYERPSKLYIRQVKGGSRSLQWLVVSDGKTFSYGHNPDTFETQQDRLREPVQQGSTTYDVNSIYAISATEGLGDRSIPLDIAIGRREDLSHDNLTWMTVQLSGKTTLNGVAANVVEGNWRPYGEANHAGTYQMVIGDDGKLLRYSIVQRLARDPQNPNDTVELWQTWDVDLTVNGAPVQELFKAR